MSLELVESIKHIAREIAREFTESINANTEAHNKLLQFYMDNPHIIGASGADENLDQDGAGAGQDSGGASAGGGGSESARESGGGDSGNGQNNLGNSVKTGESSESAGKPDFLKRSKSTAPTDVPEMDSDTFLDYVTNNLATMVKMGDSVLQGAVTEALWVYCQTSGVNALEQLPVEKIPPVLAALWDDWTKYFDETPPNKAFAKLFALTESK